MSGYYFYSFHFAMRPDCGAAEAALSAVAEGRTPPDDLLDQLHPVARYYLSDPTRFLHDEAEPRVGTPVRLARSTSSGQPLLSIELCLHDDAFANGGYQFWLWILSLVDPPTSSRRAVIGYSGLYRNDAVMRFAVATADGIIENDGDLIPYDAITEQLADWAPWLSWPR